MIAKVIHYCWFGRGEKPKLALKCIESWLKHLPDYEIKEWNEDNFDVACNRYVSEAYGQRKFAFVSDYARFWILYHHGGLYFDTDVELIAPLDDIVAKGAFMGVEKCEDGIVLVNPGLGIGAEKGNAIYREVLDYYDTLHYLAPNGKPYPGTVVGHTTKILLRHGLQVSPHEQNIEGIRIYPQDYFNPYDYVRDRMHQTPNTRSIHWYGASWISPWGRLKLLIGKKIRKYLLR